MRAAAPDVADGQRQRVGGVGGPGQLGEPQQPGHHGADLRLVGAAAAGDGGLDLAGGVQRDRQAAPGGHDDGDRAGLRGAHDRADVVLAEDPLDRDRVGPVLVEPLLDAALDGAAAGRRAPRRPAVRTTPTATRCSGRPGAPSTTPTPHRVSPGSTPSTRTLSPPARHREHLFGPDLTQCEPAGGSGTPLGRSRTLAGPAPQPVRRAETSSAHG